MINISSIPEELKTSTVLNYKYINAKSSPWDITKTVSYPDNLLLIHKMMKTCLEDDGIGLAAPQIGIFKQLFIIRHMDADSQPLDAFIPYFNPEWKAVMEDGKETDTEGCLSVWGQVYEVARWKTIDATWYELQEDGSFIKREERMNSYKARIFQHEFAHLRARSIVDDGKAINVKAENKKQQRISKTNALKNKAAGVKSTQGARPKYS